MENTSTEIKSLLQHGYRYALSMTHNTTRAEDLLQDAWVAILQANGPLEKNYLFSAIRSRFINTSKRDRLVPMVPLETDKMENQEDDVYVAADNDALADSLATLRPVEREAIYLSAVEGYTAEEIAIHTNQPRGTILSLIHRSRKKLRQYFERDIKEVGL